MNAINNFRQIVSEVLELPIESIEMNTILNEEKIDSISFIRIVVACELQFKMNFEDEVLLLNKYKFVRLNIL
jgi:acyl carrier protein